MAEMTPADVPLDILLAFTDAEAHCWGDPVHGIRYAECCRRAGLAAVLPLIQQQTRAAVLAEVEQERAHEASTAGDEDDPALCCCQQGLMCAACGTGRHPQCPDWRGEREDDDA